MKKEYIFVIGLALLILAYVLDYFAGPVSINVLNPIKFLSGPIISKYPFTAVGIGARTLGLFLAAALLISSIEKAYFLKAVIVFFVSVLAELYCVQQFAGPARMLPMQWILSISYAAPLSLSLTVFYILKGIVLGIHSKISDQPKTRLPQEESQEKTSKSILEP